MNGYFNKYGFIFNKVVVDDFVFDEEMCDSMNVVKWVEFDLVVVRKNCEVICECEVGVVEVVVELFLKCSEVLVKVCKDNGLLLVEIIKVFKEVFFDVFVSYLMEIL